MLTNHTEHKTPELKIEAQPIFYLPPQVDLQDLQQDGSLLTQAEFDKATKAVGNNIVRISKTQLGIRYSVIGTGKDLFVIYKGERHSKSLGGGVFGNAKLTQQHISKKWFALKLQRFK